MGYSRRLDLIERHTPTARRAVGAFVRRFPATAYLLDDLNSAADLALVLAVKKYMAGKVANLSGFLPYYVYTALWREVRAANVVYVPRGKQTKREPLTDYPYESETIDPDLVQQIANSCLDDTDRLIVALLSTGLNLAQVAGELEISERTVTRRRSALRRRMEGLE